MSIDKFAKSLAEPFKEEKPVKLNINYEDRIITKVAGLDIYQPTVDNVENFIRRYTLNETAFFPKAVRVDIQLVPDSFNTTVKGQSEHIRDAHGVVTLGLHQAKIELPFLIRDSEFVPFDVIQMKGERVPYTRENLAKVLIGIDKVANNPQILNPYNPYVGVDKPVNPTTDHGFLGNVLQIRDQAMVGQSDRRGEILVTAEEEQIEELLEKTAQIKPLYDQDFNKIHQFLLNKYADEFIDEMEKIATAETIDIENHVKLVLGKLKDLPLVDVNTLPNGTKIEFPEKKDNDINMTKAIVMKEVITPDYNRSKELKTMFEIKKVLVITEDGRFITLKDGAKFYALRKDGEWKLPTVSINAMKPNNIYTAIIGDKATLPFIVRSSHHTEYTDSIKNTPEGKNLPKPFKFSCKIYPNNKYFNIAQVPGVKFEPMKRGDAIENYYENISSDLLNYISAALPYEFFGVDESVKVVKLTGQINDYLVNPKDLVFTSSNPEEIFKSAASSSDQITLRAIDKDRGIYDLEIRYVDKSKKLFKDVKREFKGIRDGKVKGILRAAGLEFGNIITLIERAKGENQVSIPLPENATPDKISGGYVEDKAEKALNKIKNNIYTKEVADIGLSEVLGRQLGEVVAHYGPKAIDTLQAITSFAEESEALGIKFEKLAKEYNNRDFLNIAKIMVAQNNIDKANVGCYKSNEKYAFVKEASKQMVELKPTFEKIAYKLIELKVDQYQNRDEIVSPNVIGATVRTLDRIYKQANAVVEACDEASTTNKDKKDNSKKEVDLKREIHKDKPTVEDSVVDGKK